MSIIGAVRDYIKAYTGLPSGAPMWVQYLGAKPGEYGVISQPGAKIVERYLDGGSLREFPFALVSTESTMDDLTRLQSDELYEALSDWMEKQSDEGNLPDLGEGKNAIAIEALSWAYLIEQGESGTGVMQLLCKLTYEQSPIEEEEENDN